MAKSYVSLKLLIDTKAKRVLFGEADKKFVDFLFNILSLPLGSVMKLIKNQTTSSSSSSGSIGNIYNSVESMSDTYLQPNLNKDVILKPKFGILSSTKLFPNIESSSSTDTLFYLCIGNNNKNCLSYFSDGPNAICPSCNRCMMAEGVYVKPPSESTTEDQEKGGYVKSVVTYMVMDDLTVKPMSNISTITLLKNFNVNHVDALQEKLVTFDVNEGVKLLEASLRTKTVLTDVFLKKGNLTTPKEEKELFPLSFSSPLY